MKFKVTIELGNEAMESTRDLAFALRQLSDKIETASFKSEGKIMDINGNAVGKWSLK